MPTYHVPVPGQESENDVSLIVDVSLKVASMADTGQRIILIAVLTDEGAWWETVGLRPTETTAYGISRVLEMLPDVLADLLPHDEQ